MFVTYYTHFASVCLYVSICVQRENEEASYYWTLTMAVISIQIGKVSIRYWQTIFQGY